MTFSDVGVPTAEPAPSQPSTVAATLALGLGIAAFFVGWFPFVGIALGIAAVWLGILALIRRQPKGRALTGLILGAVAIITSLFLTIGAIQLATMDADARGRLFDPLLPQIVALPTPEPETEAPEPEPSASEPAAPPPSAGEVTTLDDAGLAALVADPVAHFGQQNRIYGEIQYVDETGGFCSALVIFDDAQQTTWEAYEIPLWGNVTTDVTCDALKALEEYSHVLLTVTWRGAATTEWEDGTAEDVLTADLNALEVLPALE